MDLVPAQEPQSGFGPGSGALVWLTAVNRTTLKPQKQLLAEHSVFSKPRYFHSNAL